MDQPQLIPLLCMPWYSLKAKVDQMVISSTMNIALIF